MAEGAKTDRVVRILMVEDDSHIGRIIELSLSVLGMPYEFASALSAEEGLEYWQNEPFDLLLTDYNLRGMNGLKLITHLKEQGVTVPMVLITAYDTPQLAREAQQVGVDAYIPKPFFVDDMIEHIRRLLPTSERAINDTNSA